MKGSKTITWMCNQTNPEQTKAGRVIMRGYEIK